MKLELPSQGGSYIRLPDGSLTPRPAANAALVAAEAAEAEAAKAEQAAQANLAAAEEAVAMAKTESATKPASVLKRVLHID